MGGGDDGGVLARIGVNRLETVEIVEAVESDGNGGGNEVQEWEGVTEDTQERNWLPLLQL